MLFNAFFFKLVLIPKHSSTVLHSDDYIQITYCFNSKTLSINMFGQHPWNTLIYNDLKDIYAIICIQIKEVVFDTDCWVKNGDCPWRGSNMVICGESIHTSSLWPILLTELTDYVFEMLVISDGMPLWSDHYQ